MTTLRGRVAPVFSSNYECLHLPEHKCGPDEHLSLELVLYIVTTRRIAKSKCGQQIKVGQMLTNAAAAVRDGPTISSFPKCPGVHKVDKTMTRAVVLAKVGNMAARTRRLVYLYY